MALIIFGSKRTPIDVAEFLVKCPSCETYSWADFLILSKYFHVYWIPIFPTEKEADIICKRCGLKRYERAFDEKLISNFDEVKRNYKHPWFTYVGSGGLIVIFMLIVLSSFI